MSRLGQQFGVRLNLSGGLTQEEILQEIEKGLKMRLQFIKGVSSISDYGHGYKQGMTDALENVLAYLENAIT